MNFKLLFSDYFEIDEDVLAQYGALDICVESDLPLFIDPFLLFASEKPEYKALHKKIISHLLVLKEIATSDHNPINYNLFRFPEIKQNWLGLCKYGNSGKGLGKKFAIAIVKAFSGFYKSFGEETITDSSHIEKLTLLGEGIGKDFISDFTTNLILEYLLEFTEKFAKLHLRSDQRKKFSIRCNYDQKLKIWKPREFELPYFYLQNDPDYIILTPLDILTKDDSFINQADLVNKFTRITTSIGNLELRNSINSYFNESLPKKPKQSDKTKAIRKTIEEFPEILDYYIKSKERNKDQSVIISEKKINQIKDELIETLKSILDKLVGSSFYETKPNSYQEALKRLHYLKDVIENNDGYRIFYKDGKAIANEDTIQRIFRLTWYASPYDVNSEVNNGRGPADYKVSFGRGDSTIIEFKLARSSSLKNNLKNQTEIYKKASKSIKDIKAILCYTISDINKVNRILKDLEIKDPENIVIIDARPKLSASKVK